MFVEIENHDRTLFPPVPSLRQLAIRRMIVIATVRKYEDKLYCLTLYEASYNVCWQDAGKRAGPRWDARPWRGFGEVRMTGIAGGAFRRSESRPANRMAPHRRNAATRLWAAGSDQGRDCAARALSVAQRERSRMARTAASSFGVATVTGNLPVGAFHVNLPARCRGRGTAEVAAQR
ncbi:MAG TPA: hypothetical protein VMU87_22225 [Stellaceae bacterium]|nr:hypothetical protein [Stellaceae bacterium]